MSNPVGLCALTLLKLLNSTFNLIYISSLSQDPFCFDSCSMNIKNAASKLHTSKSIDTKKEIVSI